MANNIFQQQITPIKPKVLEGERIYVYVPKATKDTPGIASFNKRDFGVNNGQVSLIWPEQMQIERLANPLNNISKIKLLADEFINTNNTVSVTNPETGTVYNSNTAEVKFNRKNRDAFTRPDFVMLDSNSDFEAEIDTNQYIKYKLRRNNPLEQPSLIHVANKDFKLSNGKIEIKWDYVNQKVDDLQLKIDDNVKDLQIKIDNNVDDLQLKIDNIVLNKTLIGDENGNFATKGTILGSKSINSVALGTGAEVDAENAVQIGQGKNIEDGTFRFKDYTIIDKDGKVYTNTSTNNIIIMKPVATTEYVDTLFTELSRVGIRLKVVDNLPGKNRLKLADGVLSEPPAEFPNLEYYVPGEFTNTDNSVSISNSIDSSLELVYNAPVSFKIKLKPNTTYTFSGSAVLPEMDYSANPTSPAGIDIKVGDEQLLSISLYNERYTPFSETFTTNDSQEYTISFAPQVVDASNISTVGTTYFNNLQIEEGIEATEFIPYFDKIEDNVIYMVKETPENTTESFYKEYLYVNDEWELIGTTQVDLSNYYTKSEIENKLLNSYKQLILGADGVEESSVYNFIIERSNTYLPYRTNGTKFLVDLYLPIVGDLNVNKKVAITFGDTVYYVYNILSGKEHATIRDLIQVNKYSNASGYRFITEMTFFKNSDITGFAIIPTTNINDVLSLNSDEMDDYLADGGLNQGQLAICNKVITNGYIEGAIYKFNIVYPDTYSWVKLSEITRDEFDDLAASVTELSPQVARALKTPVVKPTSIKLIAVDTTNSQEMLSVGSGLYIENGELRATGGSGTGGGTIVTENGEELETWNADNKLNKLESSTNKQLTFVKTNGQLNKSDFTINYLNGLKEQIPSKNLLDLSNFVGWHPNEGVLSPGSEEKSSCSYTNETGELIYHPGMTFENLANLPIYTKITLKPNTTYTISGNAELVMISLFVSVEANPIAPVEEPLIQGDSLSGEFSYTVTTTNSSVYTLTVEGTGVGSEVKDGKITNFQLEEGNIKTEFEPYSDFKVDNVVYQSDLNTIENTIETTNIDITNLKNNKLDKLESSTNKELVNITEEGKLEKTTFTANHLIGLKEQDLTPSKNVLDLSEFIGWHPTLSDNAGDSDSNARSSCSYDNSTGSITVYPGIMYGDPIGFPVYRTITLKPNTTYTISGKCDESIIGVAIFLGEISNITQSILDIQYTDNGTFNQTFTTLSETEYLMYFAGSISGSYPITYSDAQIEEGETATAFEPYYGTPEEDKVLYASDITIEKNTATGNYMLVINKG